MPSKSYAQTAPQDTSLLTLYKELPDSLIQQYDTTDVSYIKFAGYTKMDNKTFTGLRIHRDPDFEQLLNEKNIERAKTDYIVWFIPDGFILRRAENKLKTYTSESLGVERVGYKFSITKNSNQVKNNAAATDTLVVFKSQPNGYFGYIMSDVKKMSQNIVFVDSLYAEDLKQQKRDEIRSKLQKLNSFLGDYKSKMFPDNKVYLYSYASSVDFLERNIYLNFVKNYYRITTPNFIISNSNDLDYVKKKLDPQRTDTSSVHLVNSYTIESLIDSSAILKLKTYKYDKFTRNEIDVSQELKEYTTNQAKFDIYKEPSYWAKKLPKNILETEFTLLLDVLDANYWDSRSSSNVKTKQLTFVANLDGSELTIPILIYFTPNAFKLDGKDFDPRIDEDYRFSKSLEFEYRTTKIFYALNDNDMDVYNGFFGSEYFLWGAADIDRERREELAAKKEEVENKKILVPLYAKYGKQYVDQAVEGNIIVGMHEDLLERPLKLWSITSRSLVPGGYILYCKSMLDSSQRLTVKVLNKKVVYVKW